MLMPLLPGFVLTIWSLFLLHFDCILRRWQRFRWQWCCQQHHRAAVRAAPAHIAEAAIRISAELWSAVREWGKYVVEICKWGGIQVSCMAAADIFFLFLFFALLFAFCFVFHFLNLHHDLSTLDPACLLGTWFDPHAERGWRTFDSDKSNFHRMACHPWPNHVSDSCWSPIDRWSPCKMHIHIDSHVSYELAKCFICYPPAPTRN